MENIGDNCKTFPSENKNDGPIELALRALRKLPQNINDSLSFVVGVLASHPVSDARAVASEEMYKAAMAMHRHLEERKDEETCEICDAERKAE